MEEDFENNENDVYFYSFPSNKSAIGNSRKMREARGTCFSVEEKDTDYHPFSVLLLRCAF
jgi:hypothetical protein